MTKIPPKLKNCPKFPQNLKINQNTPKNSPENTTMTHCSVLGKKIVIVVFTCVDSAHKMKKS